MNMFDLQTFSPAMESLDANVSQPAFGVLTTCAPGIRGYPGPPGEHGVYGFFMLKPFFMFFLLVFLTHNPSMIVNN